MKCALQATPSKSPMLASLSGAMVHTLSTLATRSLTCTSSLSSPTSITSSSDRYIDLSSKLVSSKIQLNLLQGTGLQGQAVFRTKLSFRPHSTDSQTHKKMTLSMADRSSKTNQIKVISMVGADPDVNRWARIKSEESALRQSLRNDGKNKRLPSKGGKLSGGYLEGGGGGDSDDDAAVSIAAIKAKYGKGGATAKAGASGGGGLKAGPGKPVYSSGSDSDSGDSRKGGRKSRKSSGSDSDSGKSKGSSKSRSRSASSKSRSPSSSRSR